MPAINPERPQDYLIRHEQWAEFAKTLSPDCEWAVKKSPLEWNPWECQDLSAAGPAGKPLPENVSLVVFRNPAPGRGIFYHALGKKSQHNNCHSWNEIIRVSEHYEVIRPPPAAPQIPPKELEF